MLMLRLMIITFSQLQSLIPLLFPYVLEQQINEEAKSYQDY